MNIAVDDPDLHNNMYNMSWWDSLRTLVLDSDHHMCLTVFLRSIPFISRVPLGPMAGALEVTVHIRSYKMHERRCTASISFAELIYSFLDYSTGMYRGYSPLVKLYFNHQSGWVQVQPVAVEPMQVRECQVCTGSFNCTSTEGDQILLGGIMWHSCI